MVVVDAGNLLFKRALAAKDTMSNASDLVIAHGIVRAYKAMSYDAVAISTKDLSAGFDFFHQKSDESFPWIAANIYNKNDKLMFLPHIVKKAGDLTIGIIGLTGGTAEGVDDFVIGDWRKALRREMASLKNSCDMLVVLSNLSVLENEELQKDYNSIDIIVTASQHRTNVQPRVLKNSLLVQSGNRGKYLGNLNITRYAAGNWFVAPTRSQTNLKNKLSSIDRQLSKFNKQGGELSTLSSQKIVQLQSYRQNILDQMVGERENDLSEKGTTLSKLFKFSTLPVRPISTREDITTIVQDIKTNINTINRYQHARLQPDDTVLNTALQKDEINGVTGCSHCHEKQYDFWKNTKHANAFATLSQVGQSYNLQCLPCHVTAGTISVSSSEPQKLYLLSLSTDRQTIGCEVCHGPGKKHLLAPDHVTPNRLPPEEICTQCHTPEHDNNFNYQKKLAAVACPAN